MRKILDVLRLRLDAKLSDRQTARSLGVPRTTVRDYVGRFRASGLRWPVTEAMDEATLARALFARDVAPPITSRPLPDWPAVAEEKKRKGVTLHLLWAEYREREPAGYGYSQFAERYRRWRATIDPVMRQEYRAGERIFVDYAGLTMDVVDATTG
ncbi:MAG: helix-turn-helix domain-containing protein [Gemmatimonadaceae bacterium]